MICVFKLKKLYHLESSLTRMAVLGVIHRRQVRMHICGWACIENDSAGPHAGDKKAGSVRILYDTTWSTRGVLQTVGRKPRGKNPFDFQVGRLSHLRTIES